MVNLFWVEQLVKWQTQNKKKLTVAYLTHAINQIIETFEEIVFYDFNLTEKCELNIDDARLAGGMDQD